MIEVFRSARQADAQDRALVLVAAGMPAVVVRDGSDWIVLVSPEDAERASAELAAYSIENRPDATRALPPPRRVHPWAWVGSAGYVLLLFGIGYLVASGTWPLDAFDRGTLHGADIRHGEWWRATTALTLHVDSAHLAANIGFGAWFGYLAGQQLGPGIAWLAIVAAATLTNLVDGALGPPEHRSVGASTAVFAALGLLVACGWREPPVAALARAGRLRRRLTRWAPLVAGFALLGFLGTEGESTDVVAHFGGFCAGIAVGLPLARPAVRRRLVGLRQGRWGVLALGIVALAWGLALRSA